MLSLFLKLCFSTWQIFSRSSTATDMETADRPNVTYGLALYGACQFSLQCSI